MQDVILVAPPGAGKSTCLPLHLLQTEQFANQKIIMLQPRRLAVRAIAAYLAAQLGEPVGQTVGYQIRGERRSSANTRLEIVTEGILLRRLQQDPELKGVGLILFDEFHERSTFADMSLALALEVCEALRDDLRLLVMSATLDIAPLKNLMPAATLIECEGRQYPVKMVYRPIDSRMPLTAQIGQQVLDAVQSYPGSALVFLPGQRLIRQLQAWLCERLGSDVCVHCLYGELDKVTQQQAIQPAPAGQRKVVLSTNIAETSLTIEGIGIVVDSGLENVAAFDLKRGITRLHQQRIAQSSATQRAGRAGRVQQGVCYRLWSAEQQQRLASQPTPEILQCDIAPFILEAAAWGSDLAHLPLLDRPTDAQLAAAYEYLLALETLDEHHHLTAHGQQIQQLGAEPGIANMLLYAAQHADPIRSLAATLAALLEGRDPLSQTDSADISLRLHWLQQHKQHSLWQQIRYWHQRFNWPVMAGQWPLAECGVLLATAYPQWLAKSRQAGRFLLRQGSGVVLGNDDPLTDQPWLVIGSMTVTDHSPGDARVRLAASISAGQVAQLYASQITSQRRCWWDNQRQVMQARQQRCLGAIVMDEQAATLTTDEQQRLWLEYLTQQGLTALSWQAASENLRRRMQLAASLNQQYDWPAMDDISLLNSIEHWLMPYLEGMTQLKQLQNLDLTQPLMAMLDWPMQQWLQTQLPTHLIVPSGERHRLSYHADGSVSLAVRMQEMYGQSEAPKLANGRLPVILELLSPARRPLQKTADLAQFWQGSYKDIQKEMKGRYPKHYWPDDPASASATTRTKKNM